MRLQTLKRQEWQQVAPFVDTLIVPIASFFIEQKQLSFQSFDRMEMIAQRVEQSLQGRVFLFPTIVDYGMDPELFSTVIRNTIDTFQNSGFSHIIVLADEKHAYISNEEYQESSAFSLLSNIVPCESEDDSWDLEHYVREITEAIVRNWQISF